MNGLVRKMSLDKVDVVFGALEVDKAVGAEFTGGFGVSGASNLLVGFYSDGEASRVLVGGAVKKYIAIVVLVAV